MIALAQVPNEILDDIVAAFYAAKDGKPRRSDSIKVFLRLDSNTRRKLFDAAQAEKIRRRNNSNLFRSGQGRIFPCLEA